MYRSADALFKAAYVRQTARAPVFRTEWVERSRRLLPQPIIEQMKDFPETLEQGHVVHLHMKDGKVIRHVFIFKGVEILGLYGCDHYLLNVGDIDRVEPVKVEELRDYDETRWLRLDQKAVAQ